jgi:serine/threonine protein kinase
MDALRTGDPLQVGVYRLVGRLGEGGMGQVFLGVSPGGRPVAVKLIRPELAADPEFARRFAREVEAARRVGGFHTAPVVDADPYADRPWMVTAYIAGPSLRAVVTGGGPLPVDDVTRLGAGLTEGLAAIHGSGLVHRDLKPANIIMADDGPRIIDFGIAQAAGVTSLTTPGAVLGTYSYMSPEQVRADRATPESDVFSLGCVLAYAATGRGPFDASSGVAIMYRVLNEQPDLGDLPTGALRDMLEACLAKVPQRRPLLADLLAKLAAGLTPSTVVSGPVVSEPVVSEPVAPGPAVPAEAAANVLPLAAQPLIEQVQAEQHENISSVSQQANASPHSVVIQIAGNAKIGDDMLGGPQR